MMCRRANDVSMKRVGAAGRCSRFVACAQLPAGRRSTRRPFLVAARAIIWDVGEHLSPLLRYRVTGFAGGISRSTCAAMARVTENGPWPPRMMKRVMHKKNALALSRTNLGNVDICDDCHLAHADPTDTESTSLCSWHNPVTLETQCRALGFTYNCHWL